MPAKKEILYPYFLECCQCTEDIQWQDIFEDLAYGKAPYGTFISKDYLCCLLKGKEFNYKIERKDIQLLYSEIYDLLSLRVGTQSTKERNQKKIFFSNIENSNYVKDKWSSIRKKNVKDILYLKYIVKRKQDYNLSLKNCRYLYALISMCLLFKTITTKDIEYSNGEIINIEGIEFENDKVIFKRNLATNFTKEIETIEKSIPMLSETWEKLLKEVRTSMTEYN